MHHGSGSQNMQRQLQRSKSVSGSEAEEQQPPTMAATQQQATVNHPQSPVTPFSSAASPSAPQSPNYQIIMSRSPVTGQNMNITLQNVGQMVSGNQQITLTPLPIQNSTSSGFQHPTPQWRFEPAPSSFIQVTSSVPQPMQPQSPTQHSPVSLQGVTRPGAPATALGVCGQSPTRFVEAGVLMRQISLGSPSGSSHFVYQEGTGLAQIAPATPGQVQLASPGAPGSVRERRLSQPHSQTGGTIHHLGPQSPVASGTALPTLGSPGHITTSNLPPQISSIIQELSRPMIFDKTAQGVVSAVGNTATASFSIPSTVPPSSPSLTSPPQGIPNNPLAASNVAVGTVKKQASKKLEEIAPSTPEIAQLRKQCLEHHAKKMESLKEVFKEYLIELFFLQHLQGNMMDYLAFKKKPCVPLYTYLRQNDLDLEDEEEEEEQSEVINDEVKVVTGKDGQAVTPVAIATQLPPNVSAAFSVQQQFQGHQGGAAGTIANPGDMDAFKRQQAMVQADQAKRSRIDVGRHGLIFQHPGVAPLGSPGVPLQQLMPTAQGGMPPTPQAVQIAGQKQNQQQYDPSKGPPVQNAASLHTPPPQLPGRLTQGVHPMASLPITLSQQAQLVENTAQTGGQLQATVKVQAGGPLLATVNPHTQLQAQLQQQMQPGSVIISVLIVSAIYISQESQVHQRISELRKEGQWSASRLPKLVEASRPKSHWDYLLEEMQWMAADFAQERRWKEAAAKKLVRTCARYHQEQKKTEERSQKEREIHLRHIASTIAREVEFFWSNIEQVVEIKLQFEIYEKRLKALRLQKASAKVPDEESTIEEQEAMEGEADHNSELVDLAKDAEMPLDALMKQYAGAYVDSFEWPQPSPHSDDDDMEETEEMENPIGSPPEAVLIDSLLSVDQYRGADKATSSDSNEKPARDIAEVAAATEVILPKGSFRTTSSVRHVPAPFLLHGSLREYQQIGVDWLVNLYKKRLNGILADETGLGKTVQTVAYMAQLAGQEGIWGPHLIVVRTCKLLNWEMEFKRWCPGLKILLYLGNRRERRSKRMMWGQANSFHVCVTSYKLLMKDQRYFLRRRWRHLVLDEVQLIKNMTEKHWETIFAVRSEQRILLINTPLQNTLKELWTMIHFLLPGITRPYSDFPVKAGTDQNQDYCHKLVIRLHRMIQPFILRRSKRDVEKQLPKKYEHILKCRLSSRQKSLYEDILTQPGAQEALKTGHFVSVLQVLMQLQRVCNHPELVAPRETSSSYFWSSLQYSVPSLVLGALQDHSNKIANMSIFDLINNENRLTRYQTEEAVPKLKVTRQLIEEIYTGPDPPPRPKPCPIKPMRLEIRSLNISLLLLMCLFLLSIEGGDMVKIAQTANIAGGQNRISQPETPVTLQFQGNKFTLSPSQLRQLTTGQPLQLQGNILQIVSAPGQQMIRPQASMVMQTMPQAIPAANASATPGTLHPTISTAQQGESSEEKTQQMKERLSCLFEANERRCSRRVLYGSDLLQACSLSTEPGHTALTAGGWRWVGRESCLRAQRTCVATASALQSTLLVCVVPPAVAPLPHLYAANPPVPYRLEQKSLHRQLQEASVPYSADIHDLVHRHLFHFPDLQLMQMESGKLEALAILLQKLRSESRRVLIFTQMVKMLDILEAFLDYRQLTYVRVDESLTPDERRENIKRFNRNRQVFCSILTNRCCSAVGTVFDADTIIFYDTDLNPSMDARTQEWCDKIGRSKDIHIYRLESGNSIEEKLLKNGTKDLIREVAAQGTDYTLAFLTQRTIQDLFEVEAGSGEKVEEFVVLHQEPSASEAISPRVARPYIQALYSIHLDGIPEEEEQQRQEEEELADKQTTEDNRESESQATEEPSQIEELNAVMEQLTPIEKYALHYLEYLHISDDEKCSKRGWELQNLRKLKDKEEEQQMMEGEEDLFTYTREDAYNMEYIFDAEDGHTEIMPLWTPPTPPQDDNDIYIDSVMMLMYDTTPMPESKLPPIYIRKEHKRLKMDPSAAARKKKKGHGETVIPPRSLFEKASMLKVRREGKDQKKNFSLKQQAPFAKPLPSLVKPAMEVGQDNPEWLISEDWALLQAVKQLLELPLNLTIVSPAHTPNWDLVSDVVNSCSRIYRSPKQCRNRYENVIIPREEGKSKNSRPLRTCQIYTQDDNATHIQLYNSRFELMKIIASKRSPPIKPLLGMNPFQKNPKHASVLAESGISYDKPLPPIQVASQRAERIAKEKKVTATLLLHMLLFLFQPAGAPGAQVVHTQQRAAASAAPAEVVTIPTGSGVRAVTPASTAGSTTLSPGQSQTRPLTSQVTTGSEMNTGFSLKRHPLQPITIQKQKQLQQHQQVAAAAQSQQAQAAQQATQVQPAQATQANPQLAAVTTPRPGAVLTGTPVTNLQVTRLARVTTQGQIQTQAGQTAQVTLTKPPVVSVPAVVSSPGVTTLPVSVASISVAINTAQKTGVKQPQHTTAVTAATAAQKAGQPQQGQATVQQKIGTQQVTVQAGQLTQQPQQKVTYAATTPLQPGIKTQFFTTSVAQPQKPAGAQQIQVTKLPQIVQQQPTVANIQQIVSSPQQVGLIIFYTLTHG
uniref:E1A binding protein p400 n=1 Tax=Anabas testudineus TaxID=64144 RepID=A0AAQ6IC67_ANATE